MIQAVLKSCNEAVDTWLLAPEANAAGRLGIVRILYSLFFLWHLSTVWLTSLSGIPHEFAAKRVLMIEWLPIDLPVAFLGALEALLVGALIFLLVGYRTRMATAVVLVCGCLVEALLTRTDFERNSIMLFAVIPATLLFVGDWSAKYSLDAVLRERSGKPVIDASDTSAPFVLPIHVVLAILVFLFASSGVYKLLPGATWLTHPENFGNIVLERNIELARRGLTPNPMATFVATQPGFELIIRYFVVILELAFVFVFVSRPVAFFLLAWALFFHSLNAIFLLVTFTPILITYALFVDWVGLWRRAGLPNINFARDLPSRALIGGTIFVAVLMAGLWNATPLIRDALNLGGLIDARTIWFPVLPIATIVWMVATYQVCRPVLRRVGLASG